MTVRELVMKLGYAQKDRMTVLIYRSQWSEKDLKITKEVIFHDLLWKLIKNDVVRDVVRKEIAEAEVFSFNCDCHTMIIEVK